MYESHHQSPATQAIFVRRLIRSFGLALGLLLASLGLGMLGYMHFESLKPVDAFLNASMLLGGMGPVDPPKSSAGKIFAGCYALYAGLVFVATTALVFTPVIHRVLHKFHWSEKL